MTSGSMEPWLMILALVCAELCAEPMVPSTQFRTAFRTHLSFPLSPQLSIADYDEPQKDFLDEFGFHSSYNRNNGASQKYTKELHDFEINQDLAVSRNWKRDGITGTAKIVHSNLSKSNEFFASSSRHAKNYAEPTLQLIHYWSSMDFDFDNEEDRKRSIENRTFVPENVLPLGLEIWRDKIFISLPKWRGGIPATLAVVPVKSTPNRSPKLKPYPNWRWHSQTGNCQGLTSVFRMQVDECNRLWVLDSGKTDIVNTTMQICRPKILVFDLLNDELIRTYEFPVEHIKEDSLYINIVVDSEKDQCNRAVAYAADVWRFGLVVYDLFGNTSFRIEHPYFFPDPMASRYQLHGLDFYWMDGIFGLAIGPKNAKNGKTLFFHSMSSFREFGVSLDAIRDKISADNNTARFEPIGQPRAAKNGHSSGSAIDRNGIMFSGMVTRDSVWCWDTRKEHKPKNFGVIASSNVSLFFPNDVRVDHEDDQSVWIISNKLPMYLNSFLNKSEINFRILKINVKEAVKNNVCKPNSRIRSQNLKPVTLLRNSLE